MVTSTRASYCMGEWERVGRDGRVEPLWEWALVSADGGQGLWCQGLWLSHSVRTIPLLWEWQSLLPAVPPNTPTLATRFQHDICEGKIHPNNCPSNYVGPYSQGLYLEEAKPQRWMCWDAEGELHEQMLMGRPAGICLPVFVPSLESPWRELMIFYHWASHEELLPQPSNWVKTASKGLYTISFWFCYGLLQPYAETQTHLSHRVSCSFSLDWSDPLIPLFSARSPVLLNQEPCISLCRSSAKPAFIDVSCCLPEWVCNVWVICENWVYFRKSTLQETLTTKTAWMAYALIYSVPITA